MKRILLIITALLCLISGITLAQDRTVSGVITSAEDGSLIPGVNVVFKDSNIGSISDMDGKYSLNVPSDDGTLIFSFIGLVTMEVDIGNRSIINAVMNPETKQLSEVVVTAFGIERDKKALGYTTQKVSGAELVEARQPNVANNLSGRVAGVQITSNSMPGSGSHIVIRGSASVSGNNQPLVVVDGVPLEQTSDRRYGGGLSEINPDNIKEINVLKGATAAALYGSRAANGVIMVTTKDGSGTKGIGVELNSNFVFERPLVKPGFQNIYGGGSGYRTWYVDGRNGTGADGITGTAGVDESWGAPMDRREVPLWYSAPGRTTLSPQPNNWDDFWETGTTFTNNIAVFGGNDLGNFRLSVGRLDQDGIMYKNDYYRNNFKLNTNYNLTKKLGATISAEYIKSGSNNRGYTEGSEFIWAHRHTDFSKLKNWRDYYDQHATTFKAGDNFPYANWQHEYFSNPYYVQEALPKSNEKGRLVGNIALNYAFNDNLSLMVRSGTDFWSDTRIDVELWEQSKNNSLRPGRYAETVLTSQETNSDIILTFKNDVTRRFSISTQLGAVNRTNQFKNNFVRVNELVIDGMYNLANNRTPNTTTSEIRESVVNSVFGSAQFGFNNYLFLDVTGRNDWSSTLPVNENSFFYPSVALSAVITDMVNLKSNILSFAKIRASWAQVGNDASPYQLQQVFNPLPLWAGTTPTFEESNIIANKNLKPEITTGKEIGMDLRLLQGRLGVDLTYYEQSTKNQILGVEISKSSGYDSKILNAGEITNKGIELVVSGTPIQLASGFSWDITLNWSRNRNLVVELAEGLENYILNNYFVTSEARIGEPYGTFYGRRFLRAPDGQIIYENGLPVLEAGTFALGNLQPDWTGGISNVFRFKGISLGTLIDIKMGGDIFDLGTGVARKTGQYAETAVGREEGVIGQGVKNIGSAESPQYVSNDVIVNAVSFYNEHFARTRHEAGIFDGSYVKLREITLGFTFPQGFLKNNFIQSLRLSVVGRNLAILHKNTPHIDPEVDRFGGNGQGFAYGQIPTTRSVGFNLNVAF